MLPASKQNCLGSLGRGRDRNVSLLWAEEGPAEHGPINQRKDLPALKLVSLTRPG